MKLEHDWFGADVPANVILGPRTWLYSSYAFLHCRSRMEDAVVVGADTGLYKGTFFELGESGRVRIGDYCTLVAAKLRTNRFIIVGDYSLIAHNVVIADSPYEVPPDQEVRHVGELEPGPGIVVGRNVWIGAAAILLGGATVGDNSIIGAAAVVDFEVPPNSVVAGNPGRIVGRIPASSR